MGRRHNPIVRPTILATILALSLLASKKPSLPERYNRWLNQEVVYLITNEERKAFLQLPDDSARDKFMDEFWEIRNPSRGSKENSFKEEHDLRIQYANENFGRRSNTPGWQTDMGRTYILFGKPVSKVSFTGYGQIYPLELWFYENWTSNPSLPSFFYVLFFIPEDIGEYRYYHPIMDGPMELVRGTQFQSNQSVYKFLQPLGGDIAHAVFSLIPGEPIDNQTYKPNMSGEMLLSKIENLANDSFNVKRIRELRALRGQVSSYLLVKQESSLDLSWVALADPEGQYWLDYSVWIRDEKLGHADKDAKNLIVTAGFRLTSESGELIVDDTEERAFPAFEGSGSERRFVPFQIANRLPLVPGTYRLQVQLTDRQSSKLYQGEAKVTVEGGAGAAVGSPLLVASVKPVTQPDPTAPFQYFGIQFAAASDRQFALHQPLRLLFQLRAPEAGAKEYKIEYIVANDHMREARATFTDAVEAREFKDGRLLKSKTLTLADLPAGDYRLGVNLRGEGGVALASANVPFKLNETAGALPLYFLANSRVSSQPAVAAYIRALESVAMRDSQKASEYLRASLERNPANAYASQLLVQLYFNGQKFAQVTALYEKVGLAAFRAAPESLAQLSLSYWQTGRRDQARQVLQTAQTLYPKDPLVAAAARVVSAAPPRS